MKLTKVGFTVVGVVLALTEMFAVALQTQPHNSVVSCEDGKRKLLCLPGEYSKFDLPHRNNFNVIDIGMLL